jgi:D-glycero-alpha-D-manno-heptose 1-phosphate guanylyltransferase
MDCQDSPSSLQILIGEYVRQKNLVVLAGGFGKRLRSAVPEVPKPLAPVIGLPFLHYLIERWVEQGITQFTFLLHHQASSIKAFLELQQNEGLLRDCVLRTLTESQPLGTGGAVAFAIQQLRMTGSFLCANADTWLGSGIDQLVKVPAPAMAIVQVDSSERYGSVLVQQNKVVAFEEKQNSSGPGWINAGLYHLHADLFDGWNGLPFALERELFPTLVDAGQLLAVPLVTDFIDIGIPKDYFRFCRWIESGKVGVL